jgi:tRNA threonylcarbamoyladenosine biosynthesis protein TsaB
VEIEWGNDNVKICKLIRPTANRSRKAGPTVNRQPPTANEKEMILLIDTSQETATVALSNEGKVLHWEENKISKEHASWLHTAIARLIAEAEITLGDLKAVAVIAGPGSYTGLRVGMAAAKGFCYALNIPLITRNTLEVMAESMRNSAAEKGALICPMIDARRDEVFTALYSIGLKPKTPNAERLTPNAESQNSEITNRQQPTANNFTVILQPQSMILYKNAFETWLSENFIIFFGSGAEKWKKNSDSPSAIFEPQPDIIQAFATLAQVDFLAESWADPVYSEPFYLKEFFTY